MGRLHGCFVCGGDGQAAWVFVCGGGWSGCMGVCVCGGGDGQAAWVFVCVGGEWAGCMGVCVCGGNGQAAWVFVCGGGGIVRHACFIEPNTPMDVFMLGPSY